MHEAAGILARREACAHRHPRPGGDRRRGARRGRRDPRRVRVVVGRPGHLRRGLRDLRGRALPPAPLPVSARPSRRAGP